MHDSLALVVITIVNRYKRAFLVESDSLQSVHQIQQVGNSAACRCIGHGSGGGTSIVRPNGGKEVALLEW